MFILSLCHVPLSTVEDGAHDNESTDHGHQVRGLFNDLNLVEGHHSGGTCGEVGELGLSETDTGVALVENSVIVVEESQTHNPEGLLVAEVHLHDLEDAHVALSLDVVLLRQGIVVTVNGEVKVRIGLELVIFTFANVETVVIAVNPAGVSLLEVLRENLEIDCGHQKVRSA